MVQTRKLTEEEVAAKLPAVPGWSLRGGKLHREIVFDDFSEAFAFMTRVALVAEKRDHHPEWTNVYNRVSIDLVSHDVDGISERDFDLARAMNQLAGKP